jgi:hypothetical protein
MKLLAAVMFIALSLLDIVTTHIALAHGAREANQLAVMLGEPGIVALKIAVVAVVAVVSFRLPPLTLWFVNALMFFVVVNNLTHV